MILACPNCHDDKIEAMYVFFGDPTRHQCKNCNTNWEIGANATKIFLKTFVGVSENDFVIAPKILKNETQVKEYMQEFYPYRRLAGYWEWINTDKFYWV